MKKKVILSTLGGLLIAASCNASWLHRAYQGEFCAHNRKYVVSDDGSISIQVQEPVWHSYTSPCNDPCSDTQVKVAWQSAISFQDADDLHNVISDLQKVEKDMKDADSK